MLYLVSTFDLGMLPGDCRMTADQLEAESVAHYLKSHEGYYESIVEHASTAEFLSQKFDFPVEVNRKEVKIAYGDTVYVCQVGVRLQEGQVLTKEQLDIIPVSFWVVTIMRQVSQKRSTRSVEHNIAC